MRFVETKRGEDMELQVVENEALLVINEVIETLNERKAGYDEAADQTQNPRLKNLFQEFAADTRQQINDLIVYSDHDSGENIGDGPLGVLFRTWMNFRSSFAGNKNVSLIRDCLTGEEVAVKIYEAAINSDIPDNIRRILRRQRGAMLQVTARLEEELKKVR